MKNTQTDEERAARDATAERRITVGAIGVNALLTALKLAAGIAGHSQALVADAAHSLSDFATDFAVLAGVRMGRKPRDDDHRYGHGKYETLAAAFVACVLGWGALGLAWRAVASIVAFAGGEEPGEAASAWGFWVAVASVAAKGALCRATLAVARRTGSSALVANAWHQKSDALSSVAVAAGVGASAFLGGRWGVLDPVAALFVAVLLGKVSWDLLKEQLGVLTDRSLSPALCEEILEMARGVGDVTDPHHLRTRWVGRWPVIDLHVRLPADMTLEQAHAIATVLEDRYRERFGNDTIVNLHLEPARPPEERLTV